jgi:hypothetical protein
MATDIMLINSEKEANILAVTCSTTNTGFSSSIITVADTVFDQKIDNISSKFDDKFDDITYYFDDQNSNVLGV